MSTIFEKPETGTHSHSKDGVHTQTHEAHSSDDKPRPKIKKSKRPLWMAGLTVGCVALLSTAGWSLMEDISNTDQPLIFYTASKGDLPITYTERGNLESQVQTTIRCEVESLGYDRNSGNSGTQIIFIVPNGKAVEKGELLVELDAAPLTEKLNDQVIIYERANAEAIQAEAKYQNQQTQNVTRQAEAELQVELAELNLKMYGDEADGTFKITLQELDLKIQEAQSQLKAAEAAKLLQIREREGMETLYSLGYRGRGDLDQARYKLLQAEDQSEKARNTLDNAISARRKLVQYEREMKIKELNGAMATAQRALEQVKIDNESLLAQALAAKTAAERALTTEKEKLDRYRTLLTKCKIYAPHEGMAVYAMEEDRRSSSSAIAEGAFVRERQRILTLPNLSKMQVKTSIHESILDQVRAGLPVTIKIDAFADRTYRGTVQSVAVLPKQADWMSSDIKVYETIVTIDEEVDQLKPGMTAVVEIHIDRLHDVLSVPVQAIVQIGKENWCYVGVGNDAERRTVKLGKTNDKFVQVVEGLAAADRVVLNPMSIMDETQRAEARPAGSEPGAAEAGKAPLDEKQGAAGGEKGKDGPESGFPGGGGKQRFGDKQGFGGGEGQGFRGGEGPGARGGEGQADGAPSGERPRRFKGGGPGGRGKKGGGGPPADAGS
jgi:RND family efflux transporter MFP subunit